MTKDPPEPNLRSRQIASAIMCRLSEAGVRVEPKHVDLVALTLDAHMAHERGLLANARAGIAKWKKKATAMRSRDTGKTPET